MNFIKNNGVVLGSLILVISGLAALFFLAPASSDVIINDGVTAIPDGQVAGENPDEISDNVIVRNTCVNHGSTISMHIHPTLSIFIDGDRVVLPSNIGIDEECMRAVHTHEIDGTIHLEFPTQYDFTLEDFFAVWGQPFNKNEVVDEKVNVAKTIRMMVNGEQSDAFEKLVLEDGQQIEIYYEGRNQ